MRRDEGASKINVSAHGANPGRAAVAVVARIGNVLEVEGVEEATPGVQGVIGFDDVFAAVVEGAIAEQKAEPTQAQIVLMVAFDGVGDHGKACFVCGAAPTRAGIVGACFDGLVHLCVCEGFVLALIPTEAAEDAQVWSEFLLDVVAEAVLECTEVFVQGNGWGGI